MTPCTGALAPALLPGVAEAGWTVDELNAQNRRKRDVDAQAVHKELLSIWRELEKHDSAWVFREPVDTNEVTDYLTIIKQPMGEAGREGGWGRVGWENKRVVLKSAPRDPPSV